MTTDREARLAELAATLGRTAGQPAGTGPSPDGGTGSGDGPVPAPEGPATPVSAPSGEPVVETHGLIREYEMGGTVIRAVDDVSIRIEPGQLVAVRGRSGSGKTTLLSLIGALDRPTHGTAHVTGLPVSTMPERELVGFRRRTIGFIFQAFGLLPILSAAENVEIPLRLVSTDPRERDARVRHLLEVVGLAGRANHRPARAVRRRAAARRDRAGARQQASAAAGRRADRAARLGDGPRDHGADSGDGPQRRRHGHRRNA